MVIRWSLHWHCQGVSTFAQKCNNALDTALFCSGSQGSLEHPCCCLPAVDDAPPGIDMGTGQACLTFAAGHGCLASGEVVSKLHAMPLLSLLRGALECAYTLNSVPSFGAQTCNSGQMLALARWLKQEAGDASFCPCFGEGMGEPDLKVCHPRSRYQIPLSAAGAVSNPVFPRRLATRLHRLCVEYALHYTRPLCRCNTAARRVGKRWRPLRAMCTEPVATRYTRQMYASSSCLIKRLQEGSQLATRSANGEIREERVP